MNLEFNESQLRGEESVVVENVIGFWKSTTNTQNGYFQETNGKLLRYATQVIKRIEKANIDPATGISSKPATLDGLHQLIFNSNGDGVELIRDFQNIQDIPSYEKNQNDDIAIYFLENYFCTNSVIFQNTYEIRNLFARMQNDNNSKGD